MITSNWLNDIILYIYALGLLCYFADFLQKSENAKRLGTGLLVIVWLLQASFFFIRMEEKDYFPLITLFETLFFFSWVIVTLAVVFFMLFRQEIVVYLLSVLGFILILAALLNDTSMSPILNGWDFSSQLLLVHITLGIGSYAIFSISAIFSGLYLFLHSKLKEKKWSAFLHRLPSLDRTELYAFRSVMVGCVLLLGSLILGLIWVGIEGEVSLLLDPKSLTSLLLLGTYTCYILLRLVLHASGRRLAYWNIGSCVIIVLNFVVSNYFSAFHHWVWM